ncbi:MAG: fibronectin type III domain-containing protein [Verrucomicrobiales bacterium]|nr:fibronectin type III domain-containing protein [Verrucomicrobiales bacterium]
MKRAASLRILLPLLLFSTWTARGQDPEVSTDRATYLPNEPITVRFREGPGNLLDWVGLYKETAPGPDFEVWQYLDGSQTAKAALSDGQTTFLKGLPKPGTYEVRLYENDGYIELAVNSIVVENSPRLLLSKRVWLPGDPLPITFTNAPGNAKDWIGILAAGAADTAAPLGRLYLDGTLTGNEAKTNGVVTFNAPTASASYEARLFGSDAAERLDSVAFEVGYPRPVITAQSAANSVTLKWSAPQWPLAIEKYVVLARAASGQLFEKVGEISAQPGENTFEHTGLVAGDERCYAVRAEGGAGAAQADSPPVCAAAVALEAGTQIAYDVPAGTSGNQSWNGALGMEFEVVNAIAVSHLGIFDDGSDGLKRTITARLYDRSNRNQVATVEFSPASPGTLLGGSRFKPLAAPLSLATSFKGVMVAEGYGPEERAGNTGLAALPLKTGDGNGAILFVGRSRYGRAGVYPATTDKGPANRYAAGTFQFRVTEVTAPGKPALTAIPDNGAVTLSWPAVTQPLPAAKYHIFRSAGPTGAFTQIAETASTEYRDTGLANGNELCYRVRAVTVAGVSGPDSDSVCQVPDVVQAGVAYINPSELEGNQSYTGSVGNDFDVVRPIRVTRLGAFDDTSDGLNRTLTVRLYDRSTEKELARLVFTPDDPGELIEGSRFKNLPESVPLAIGFQGTIVASGYGAGEREANDGIPGTADLNLATFTGGCLRFVGSSRFGDDPDAFPQIIDGGPANRYAAGTFYFEPFNPAPVSKLSFTFAAGTITIEWTGNGTLESAEAVTGPWEPVAGATAGFKVSPSAVARFFRLRQ